MELGDYWFSREEEGTEGEKVMGSIWTPSEAIEAYSIVKSKPKKRSTAFVMGIMAHRCGNGENFYELGTAAHKEWEKGYAAEKAKQKEQR